MKDSTITIEVAKPEDAEQIQLVFYRTWLSTYPNEQFGITKDDVEHRYADRLSDDGIQKYQKRIVSMPSDQKLFVAKMHKKIVGVSVAVRNKTHNQLSALYVLPEFQKKGAGMALWEHCKSFFDTGKETVVHVASYNETAIHFYIRLGFNDTGKRFTDERFKMKSGAIIPEIEMIRPGDN